MTKSKSKTFPKGTDMGDVVDWFYSRVQTIDEEVFYPGAEPSFDVSTKTTKKYIITVTEVVQEVKEEKK